MSGFDTLMPGERPQRTVEDVRRQQRAKHIDALDTEVIARTLHQLSFGHKARSWESLDQRTKESWFDSAARFKMAYLLGGVWSDA